MRLTLAILSWALLLSLTRCVTDGYGGNDAWFTPAARRPTSEAPPAPAPTAAPDAHGSVAPTSAGAPAPAPTPVPVADPSGCGPEIPGLADLIRPGLLLVLGDQFGSNEIPRFVGQLACRALRAGHPVQVAMELPVAEQPLLDRYLASAGTEADRRALLQGLFWLRPYQDGRSSQAVLDLIERVRAQGGKEGRAHLVACDDPRLKGNEREAHMAKVLLEARARTPSGVFILLTGNVHARTVKGVPWDATFVPLGWHLAQVQADLVSLDADYTAGTAWVCVLEPNTQCGVRRVSAPRRVPLPPRGLIPYVLRWPEPSAEGYHGHFYVGALTASPPATWSGP
jgi:hypothetical protein